MGGDTRVGLAFPTVPVAFLEFTDVLLALGGLVAGLMVGLTGMGGAVLVTPLLILGFGLPAGAAVSSDLVAAAVMKPVGATVHARRGTVHWGLVGWLSAGSVPGVLIGSLAFTRLVADGAEEALAGWIGLALLVAVGATLARTVIAGRNAARAPIAADDVRSGPLAPVRKAPTLIIGLVVGTLVGITSVGSGSLVVATLLLLYPLLRPSVLVGTDLVQAVPMLVTGALAHMTIGSVDWRVTAALLVGQVPGIWMGARLSSRYHGMLLRYLLVVVLFATSLRLLGAPSIVASVVAVVGIAVVAVLFVIERRRGHTIGAPPPVDEIVTLAPDDGPRNDLTSPSVTPASAPVQPDAEQRGPQ